jgi:hypothetical protein
MRVELNVLDVWHRAGRVGAAPAGSHDGVADWFR